MSSRSKTDFMWDRLGVWVCLSVCEVQFYDIILYANLISLCTNRHVGKCFDQTLTNEREQDKRCTHAEHRMGFLCQSVCNLLSHTLPHLDDTQNKHVEGIYDSCIDKVIMCIKQKERGGKESRWGRGNKRWRRDVQAATGVFVCVSDVLVCNFLGIWGDY